MKEKDIHQICNDLTMLKAMFTAFDIKKTNKAKAELINNCKTHALEVIDNIINIVEKEKNKKGNLKLRG